VTNDDLLAGIVRSFRDWGGIVIVQVEKTIPAENEFTQKFGNLPESYDHKYVYSEIGYNLKMTICKLQ